MPISPLRGGNSFKYEIKRPAQMGFDSIIRPSRSWMKSKKPKSKKPTLVIAGNFTEYREWVLKQKYNPYSYTYGLLEKDVLKFDQGSFRVQTVGTWKERPHVVDVYEVAVRRSKALDKGSEKK